MLPLAARADASPIRKERLLVVAVAPDAKELDAAELRAAIGKELGVDAIAPRDARATQAEGRIDVSIDREAHQLVVSYGGGAEPLVRRVELPGSDDAVSRAAVFLAGNLARDEANDLAEQLRKTKAEEQEEVAEAEGLGKLLADAARDDRSLRQIAGGSLIGAGVVAAGTATLLGLTGNTYVPSLYGVGLFGLIPVGVHLLRTPSSLEEVSAYYEERRDSDGLTAELRDRVERRWAQQATRARSFRRGAGISLLITGAAQVAVGAALWAIPTRSVPDDAVFLASGAIFVGIGLVALTTKASVESRLEDYERGTRRAIPASEVSLRLAPAAGGGLTVGVEGRF